MRCSIRRLICLSLVMILTLLHNCCIAEAEDPWEYEKNPGAIYYTSDPRQLYNAKESNYKSEIAWTIVNDGRYEGYEEVHLLKCISLKNGKVREWTIKNEYIIQKDPDEYDGVLYAVEYDEEVQVWLAQPDGQREQLASYTITYPYWEKGPQTVRAYMHGTLYYIKSLEKIDPEAPRTYPPYPAVLCSIDAEGNEYVYQLNNDPAPLYAIFHYFAISPYGKVAWVTASEIKDYRTAARSLLVETPGQGVKQVLPEGIEEQLGWNIDILDEGGIYGQSLCWIDEDHLMFGSKGSIDDNMLEHLYMLQLSSGEVTPLLNVDGNPIIMYHSIQGASCVYYNREENLIAYLGSPTRAIEWDICNDDVAVPHIIDLNTGRNYVLYKNNIKSSDEGEFRNQTGQLSWMKPN